MIDTKNCAESLRRPSVLLVGDFAREDFADANTWLEANVQLHRSADIEEAAALLAENRTPDVILFGQSRPGQFSQAEVERLHARSPLSRLVVLLGSWCEGEIRTGHPWSGVIRVYWHQWAARLIPELVGSGRDSRGVWRLPRTAPVNEQFSCAAASEWRRGQGLVLIDTPLLLEFEGLQDACIAGGYATLWSASAGTEFVSGVTAVIHNAIGGDPTDLARLTHLVDRYRPAPVVALLDYVRRDDRERVLAAGAATALAKPFLVNDLLWHLDQHIQAARHAEAA